MRDILSLLAVPLVGLITYILGKIDGRKMVRLQNDKLELDNLNSIVEFYKNTFEDLKKELKHVSDKCGALSKEINILRQENVSLKKEIHDLNEKLKVFQK